MSPRERVYSALPPDGRYCPDTGAGLPVRAITFGIFVHLLSRRFYGGNLTQGVFEAPFQRDIGEGLPLPRECYHFDLNLASEVINC